MSAVCVTSRCLWLALVLCLVAADTALAQKGPAVISAPPHIQKLINEGDRFQSAKDLSKAREKYLEAHQESNKLPEKEAKDHLAVTTALKVARLTYAQPDDPKILRETTNLLQGAVSQSAPRERSQINVILADLALRQNDPKQAITILRDADWDQFAAAQRPLLKYNLGRAYELDQQYEAAFNRYSDAIRLNPQFSLAANRAIESSWRLIEKEPQRLRNVSAQLVNLGLANRLNRFALEVLAKETANPTALALLLRSWAATYPGPKEFLASESFQTFAKNERIGTAPLAAIKELVDGPMKLNASGGVDQSETMAWIWNQKPEVQAACSTFAIAVGKWLIADSREQPDAYQALTRFMIAWELDPENINAGIESARVLTLDFPGIDPRLVDVIVQRCFEEKNGVYFRGNKSLHDWNQLEKCHTFLAMIYEKRGVWGDTSEVRSAIFQWQHAVDAHAAAMKIDSGTPVAPGLREHLAFCLAKTKEKSAAIDEYLLAIEGFYNHDDPETAGQLLADARAIDFTLSAKQQQELARLDALAPGRTAQPVLVFSMRGLEPLLDDAKFVDKIVERVGIQEGVNRLVSVFKTPDGFGGIDPSKPLGFYSYAKADQIEMPTLFIPVSNEATLKKQLTHLAEDFRDSDGLWSATFNGTKLYGKVSRGYLHISQTLPAELADPAKISNLKYDVSLQANIANIPEQYKRQVLSQIDASRDLLKGDTLPGSEAALWLRGLAATGTLTALKSVINDGQMLTIGVDIDQKSRIAAIDIALTGKPDTGLVKVLAAYGKTQPVFAGIGSESAPFRLVVSHPTPAAGEDLDRAFEEFRLAIDQQINHDIPANDQNREVVRGQVAHVLKLANSTAKTGALHSGFVLEPGRDGKVRVIGGTKVANGEEADKLLADLLKTREGPTVKYAGARIQPFHWEPAKTVEMTLGSEPAHVALRENSLWMSIGSDNLKGLESVLDTDHNRKGVPPISMQVKPAALILLMEHDNSALVRRARTIAGTPSDKFDIALAPIAGGANVHIEFAIDLFRLSDANAE